MHEFVAILQHHPEFALFLALAIGFWFGGLKFGSFSLGSVTSTLIAALLIGQLHITVAPVLQDTFFTMFLFAIGYSVGPQFIPALKKDGLPQVAYAVIVAATGLATTYAAAKILGYNPGLAAGLLAGGMTNSGTLGVAVANVHQLGLNPTETAAIASIIPIGYAVTYPFGTAGAAWFVSSLAPKLLGIDLKKACKEYEAAAGLDPHSGQEMANFPVMARAFRAEHKDVVGHTPREFNTTFGDSLGGAFITRVREGAAILEANTDTTIESGATLAIAGSPTALFHAEQMIGPEVDDAELLAYPAEKLDIVVTNKAVVNKTIQALENDELSSYGRPVFVLGAKRAGHSVPVTPGLVIQHRDVLTVRGVRAHVENLVKILGTADRPTTKSDIAFMGVGIVIGSLIGTLTVTVAGVPLSLSPFVGSLLAGLIFGYVRSIYRTFGAIPGAGLWVFNNIGLNGFIAAVGLNAGPGLVSGLSQYGIGLFIAGIFVSMIPLFVALYVGKYIFKFHPAILLGACAGARTCTAALGAVQEASESTVPTLGYTIPYAVGRIILAIFGIVVLLLVK